MVPFVDDEDLSTEWKLLVEVINFIAVKAGIIGKTPLMFGISQILNVSTETETVVTSLTMNCLNLPSKA